MRPNYGAVHYMYFPSGSSGAVSHKHEYEIQMLNDSVFKYTAKIEFTDSCSYLILKNKREKIKLYPNQTKEIKYNDGFGKIYIGIPKENRWHFKILSGTISGFSYLPESEEVYLNFVQKGIDGEYLKATEKNVLKLVVGNEKATKLATKDKLWKAINEYNLR